LGQFQRIIELFTPKIVTKLSKIWVSDPGSGKNLFRIPDPGVKKAPDPGSATLHGSVSHSRDDLRAQRMPCHRYLVLYYLITLWQPAQSEPRRAW
jgi:hypothetical protein